MLALLQMSLISPLCLPLSSPHPLPLDLTTLLSVPTAYSLLLSPTSSQAPLPYFLQVFPPEMLVVMSLKMLSGYFFQIYSFSQGMCIPHAWDPQSGGGAYCPPLSVAGTFSRKPSDFSL